MVVAKNNIRFAIRNQESGRLAGMGVLLVIPAEAGIRFGLASPRPRGHNEPPAGTPALPPDQDPMLLTKGHASHS